MMWGSNYWSGWHSGMGFGGMIMMLIFWAFIIAGIVILIRRLIGNKRSEGFGRVETPLDILKKRYAQGDISKDEFDSMKLDLES